MLDQGAPPQDPRQSTVPAARGAGARLMRRKPVKQVFPALRFLRQRAVANRRSLRLNHILLLLLRMAAIAPSFSRPPSQSRSLASFPSTSVQRSTTSRGSSGGPASAEALLRRPDGATLWAVLHLSPVREPGADRLVQIVETSRCRDLEAALGLAQRREALGQLTNGVAHEFNNLLQILVGYVDGLRRRLGEHPDAFVQRALSRSTDAAERASSLTRHLLAFSRKHRPEPRAVDLNGLLGAFRDRATGLLGPAIALDLDLAEDLWIACIDPVQTELILQILLRNAGEAMPAGGRVAIATRNHGGEGVAVDGAAGRTVELSVSDTGSGMTPEVLARALEPFFTTREPGRGTGLAILNALVKRQGRRLFCRSRGMEAGRFGYSKSWTNDG